MTVERLADSGEWLYTMQYLRQQKTGFRVWSPTPPPSELQNGFVCVGPNLELFEFLRKTGIVIRKREKAPVAWVKGGEVDVDFIGVRRLGKLCELLALCGKRPECFPQLFLKMDSTLRQRLASPAEMGRVEKSLHEQLTEDLAGLLQGPLLPSPKDVEAHRPHQLWWRPISDLLYQWWRSLGSPKGGIIPLPPLEATEDSNANFTVSIVPWPVVSAHPSSSLSPESPEFVPRDSQLVASDPASSPSNFQLHSTSLVPSPVVSAHPSSSLSPESPEFVPRDSQLVATDLAFLPSTFQHHSSRPVPPPVLSIPSSHNVAQPLPNEVSESTISLCRPVATASEISAAFSQSQWPDRYIETPSPSISPSSTSSDAHFWQESDQQLTNDTPQAFPPSAANSLIDADIWSLALAPEESERCTTQPSPVTQDHFTEPSPSSEVSTPFRNDLALSQQLEEWFPYFDEKAPEQILDEWLLIPGPSM